jgi:hypothetical protein
METETIQFRASAEAVNNALEIVSVVDPLAVTEQGQSGFFFMVGKKKEGPDAGKDFCWIYSKDAIHAARTEFPISDVVVTGGGQRQFVYLVDYLESFKYVDGEVVFDVMNDWENTAFTVKWGTVGGLSTERSTIDPRAGNTIDDRLEAATDPHTYRTILLKEALQYGAKFLASESDRNARDEFKMLNIYDSILDPIGKGDGTLHATDGYQHFFFYCDNFKGKGLQVNIKNLKLLDRFLAKCGPEVVICAGNEMTFAMSSDKSRILGWSRHTKKPLEFKTIPMKWDSHVLRVRDRELLLKQLRFMRSEMPKTRDKIRVEYNSVPNQVQFRILVDSKVVSLPIDVIPVEGSESRDYKYDVHIDQLIGLFNEVKSSIIEFRMFRMEDHGGAKGGAGFRTVDEYWLDQDGKIVGGSGMIPDPANGQVYQCKVTRFMPNKI